MNKNLLIFGNTDYATRIYSFFREYTDYNIVGFIVDKEYKNEDKLVNLPVYDTEYFIDNFNQENYMVFIAIGYTKLNTIREEKYNYLKSKGYSFANFVHPKAFIEKGVKLGDNLFIGALVNIGINSNIGNNIVFETSVSIGHDAVIEDNCFIATAVCSGGNIVIKKNCFIGVNSSIKHNVEIGEYSIVGLGSVVNKNITSYTLLKPTPSVIYGDGAKLFLDYKKI